MNSISLQTFLWLFFDIITLSGQGNIQEKSFRYQSHFLANCAKQINIPLFKYSNYCTVRKCVWQMAWPLWELALLLVITDKLGICICLKLYQKLYLNVWKPYITELYIKCNLYQTDLIKCYVINIEQLYIAVKKHRLWNWPAWI